MYEHQNLASGFHHFFLSKSINHMTNETHKSYKTGSLFTFLKHRGVADFPTSTGASFSELSEFPARNTVILSLLSSPP